MGLTVRAATGADAARCAEIYAPYVTDTAITFELEAPTADQLRHRIDTATRSHAWLVAEETDQPAVGIIGYAYAHTFSQRPAYRWSCETSIYLQTGRRRTGAGRLLYQALLDRLTQRGFRQAMAGMTLPNDASAGLHRALGFQPVGIYRRVGWKHGAWHDVAWVQRGLGDGTDPPAEPR